MPETVYTKSEVDDEIDAHIAAVQDDVVALAKRVTALERPQEPTEPPAGGDTDNPDPNTGEEDPATPEPPVEPTDPVPEWDFQRIDEPLGNLRDMVVLREFSTSSSYMRAQKRTVLVGDGPHALGYRHSLDQPLSGRHVLEFARLTKKSTGEWFEAAADDATGTFSVGATTLSGWYWSRIRRPDGRVSPRYPIYVRKDGVEPPTDWAPVWTGTYPVMQEGYPSFVSGVVPVDRPWRTVTLEPRPEGNFDPADRDSMFVRSLCANRFGDVLRPNVDRHGVIGCENMQSYHLGPLTAKYPPYALCDGPKGQGTMTAATALKFHSRGGGIWFSDAWRVGLVKPDREVVTMAGYRHPHLPIYWEDTDKMLPELVGDWSAMPEDRRGFREIWGFCWDRRTVGVDESVEVEGFSGLPGHPVNLVQFVVDTQNNRVCRLEYNRLHAPGAVPPKITEFITGLDDPWDILQGPDDNLIINERFGCRIGVYDPDTGEFIRWLVNDEGSVGMLTPHGDGSGRFSFNARWNGHTLPEVQAHTLVWPEKMDWLEDEDGRFWVYVSSSAMNAILRFDYETGERQVVTMNYGDKGFTSIAVCRDGAPWPAGTVLAVNWSNSLEGQPHVIHTDGTITGAGLYLSRHALGGRGNRGPVMSYGSAVCVGDDMIGRWGMAFSGNVEGLIHVSKAQPGDPVHDSARIKAGIEKWRARYEPIYGEFGFAFHDLPLPWGEDSDIDYMLQAVGHPTTA